MSLPAVAVTVFTINIPFGYWRYNVSRFSAQWFLAIHLVVPIVIFLRLRSGIGWSLASYPVLVCAFFLGQVAGGQVKGYLRKGSRYWRSSCLIWDAVRAVCRSSPPGEVDGG